MGASPLAGAALRVLASAVAQGAPGDADHGGPREMFDRAVELLEGVGAELELGRALTAYAAFEDTTGRTDAASELRNWAEGIRQRSRTGVSVTARLGVIRGPDSALARGLRAAEPRFAHTYDGRA